MIDIFYNKDKNIDRTFGIKRVINYLKGKNVRLQNMKAVDTFAGDGTFCSHLLATEVKNMDCFELDYNIFEQLTHNLSKFKSVKHFYNCDSISFFSTSNSDLFKYDFIFLDNPQGMYGQYFEYFNMLSNIKNMSNKKSILIHNLNVKPYKYDKLSSWANERNLFYGIDDCSDLDLEFMKEFHISFFEKLGIEVKSLEFIPREKYKGNIYLYHAVYELELVN